MPSSNGASGRTRVALEVWLSKQDVDPPELPTSAARELSDRVDLDPDNSPLVGPPPRLPRAVAGARAGGEGVPLVGAPMDSCAVALTRAHNCRFSRRLVERQPPDPMPAALIFDHSKLGTSRLGVGRSAGARPALAIGTGTRRWRSRR